MRLLLAPALATAILMAAPFISGQAIPRYTDLFNGKDLSGWVNVTPTPARGLSVTDC